MKVRQVVSGILVYAFAGLTTLQAGDPKEYAVVVSEMVQALKDANTTKQPKRLAVISFIGTRQSSARNDFGEYLTESFISEINVIKSHYKLFERKRLDVVLKENDFKLSDLVDQNQAQKLGELLPIDVIFSGTYTKLKSYVDINGRLIDVVTGEILVSFSGKIQLTADLLSLFEDEAAIFSGGGVKESALDLCRQKAKSVRNALNDLSSEDKIAAVVREATAIPFDVECGSVHYDVMASFRRYKIESDTYRRFLMGVADTIRYPGTDDRSLEIFRYLAKDSVIDRAEWALAMKTIRKIGNYSLTSHLRTLFRSVASGGDLTDLYGRIDEYFEAVRANQVGLPTPLTFTSAFFFMTDGVKSEQDNRLQFYCYDRYGRFITYDNKKTYQNVYGLLGGMYKRERDRVRKTALLEWIAEYFNTMEGNDKGHEQLFDFARSFELTSNKTTNEEIMKNFPEADLRQFVGLCRSRFSEWALLTPYANQKEDRTRFCVRYDVPLPGVIPTMDEAAAVLLGTDLSEQKRVAGLLELMGDRPKSCEEPLVKLLAKKSLDREVELKDIQESAVVILGNIRTTNAAAIDFMINSLMSFDYDMGEKAANALVGIGKPAVPAILNKMKVLTNREDALQYKLIKVLGSLGKDALAARPTLQALLQKTTNKDVRYIIEAALQAME